MFIETGLAGGSKSCTVESHDQHLLTVVYDPMGSEPLAVMASEGEISVRERTMSVFLTGAVVLAGATMPALAKDESFVQTSVLSDDLDASVIEFSIERPDFGTVRIDGSPWTTVTLGNESIPREAGEPALPDVRRSVMIGPDAAVEARFVGGDYQDYQGIQMAPHKGILLRTVNPHDVPYTFGKVYDSEGFWPREVVTIGDPYIMRNTRGAVVQVNAIQWNPATDTLRVWSNVKVAVDRVGTATENVLTQRSLTTQRDNAAWETLYGRRYVNYPDERRYDPLDNSGDMLIICYDQWLSNIQPLADHKNSIGINTTVVPVSSIGNTPSAISSYINGMYLNQSLSYVLLVGDAAHISAYTAADNGLSDPTYSKMTADDYPDIFVARISAETAAHVDTQVERVIAYENDAWTERPEYFRAAGIASTQGPGDDNEYDHEHVANIMTDLEEYGFTYTTVISDSGGSVAQGVAAVNDGLGAIAYCGHGSTTCWGNGAPLCNNDVNGLTNTHMLPWIMSVACVCGEYNAGDCFAETWMRATHNGMPAGSIGHYASTINQSWAPPMCAEDETFDCFVAEQYVTLGVLFYAGSCQMMDEYGSGGVDMFDTWTHFGEPSTVVVGTAAPPTGMRVSGSGWLAEGPNGGPFEPVQGTFTVKNHEDSMINVSVSTSGGSWVTVYPTNFNLLAGAEVEVQATINVEADSLANGTHTIAVAFRNNTTFDGDADKDITLTVGVPIPVLDWNMDEHPGWTMDGEWAWGAPTGGGGDSFGNADPNSGSIGNAAVGINLDGDYSLAVGGPYHLTTGAIDCSNYAQTSLMFDRWLNCDYQPYVENYIEVSNDLANWTRVWENSSSAETADSSWSTVEYDISSIADGQPAVYVRWGHAVTDFAWAYSGWNLDEIKIKAVDSGSNPPCDGDLNGDGVVGVDDILEAVGGFGDMYDVNTILEVLENFGTDC
ncbi:MAG: C25 family cysteine peptidase [Phycisphaerales bacterium]|nr:C25 family cysteine peptidase [Phycisphaerales bacterium]